MKRRLLTLSDLYNYYSQKNETVTFDVKNDNEIIVVQTPGKLSFEESDKDTEGLLPVFLQSCHTGVNINGSNISTESMENALPSFSNRPILGYIHDVDGKPEFYGHNMHLDEEDNIVYDEIPIGIIPESCDAKLVYDEEKGKTYCHVKGFIFEEYTKAAEILQREKKCSVSVELSIRKMSFDAVNKVLNIEDFFYSGVTILGKKENGDEVKPGMEGSCIQLEDFSAEKNSYFSNNNNLLSMLEKVSKQLSNFTIDTKSQEGGNETGMNKFEELLQKYNKTVEDITFEYAELTDEELEAKFAELFEDEATTDDSSDEPSSDEGENNTDPVDDTNTDESNQDTNGENGDESSDEGEGSEQFEKMVRSFEISHEDTRYALYSLLESFEELDNTWYWISNVYDSYFVYENWEGTKIYRQDYSKDGDNVAFENDRVELFKELLTANEKAELDSMRANYSSISEQLAQYQKAEEKANKEVLMNSTDYSSITDKEDFVELQKSVKEGTDNLSFEELKGKCDEILLNHAKSGNLSFAKEDTKPQQTVGKKTFLSDFSKKSNKGRYGSLKF